MSQITWCSSFYIKRASLDTNNILFCIHCLLQMRENLAFVWLHGVWVCIYTVFFLYLSAVDTDIVSIAWLSQTVLQLAWDTIWSLFLIGYYVRLCLLKVLISFPLDMWVSLKVEYVDCMVELFFFKETL